MYSISIISNHCCQIITTMMKMNCLMKPNGTLTLKFPPITRKPPFGVIFLSNFIIFLLYLLYICAIMVWEVQQDEALLQ